MHLRQTLLGCTAIVTTLAALSSGAFADPVTVSAVLGPGDAQQSQVGGGSLQSSLGAAATLDLSFTFTSNTQGTWTAVLKNTSGTNPFGAPGVLTDFGINLNSAFGWSDNSADFSAAGSGNYQDKTGDSGVLSEIGGPATKTDGTSGFFSSSPSFMLAADDASGLTTGQSVTLSWTVTGSGFDGHTQLSDFLNELPVDVAVGESSFSAFWVANFDNIGTGKGQKGFGAALGDTNIGGNDPTSSVPEPATLATFGAGLIGLAALRRRRKR